MKLKVLLGIGPSSNRVFLDDVEITSVLTGLDISMRADSMPYVLLHGQPEECVIEGEASRVFRTVPKEDFDA